MKSSILLLLLFLSSNFFSQCVDCGNGIVDSGETTANCPSDVAHTATCTSPCSQPGSFEATSGIRQTLDFVGTTTWSTTGLPTGWTFASGPTATSAGTLAAAGTDAYGAKGGLIQPNCSGSCTATNGFCIGNIANLQTVGGGGVNGKLGANFDGRANVSQNVSYAVLRGQGNPTLVSQTFNVSAVDGFKIQFWLSASESSCGQTNGWGSCAGNTTFLDFSTDGGTTWAQVIQMNTSSTNSDMCINNSTNTLWIAEGRWSRVCLTVYKTVNSPGNFYTAAAGGTAASGIMVNSAFFTASFKYRIRYAQTASCTSGISATNPGRYLAIDYPVFTSGNEMIPCGISFSKMCGYGEDNNDDAVGSLATTQTTVFASTKRSVNQAERGVEIFTSQNSVFASQNSSGSSFATNFDLCNSEGGDKQCIDWQSDNNFYNVIYECVADWEAASGTGINVNYYKGTTPQSFGLTKVTTAGKTALIGWRYSGSRFVSCGSLSDINPGCNGYLFQSGSLPTQFNRGFYGLATNSSGQSWSYYGATSCSHYFSGPFFSPIATPIDATDVINSVVCDGANLVFSSDVNYCSSSAFTGLATINISGPGGFLETIDAGTLGSISIDTPGDYTLIANVPSSLAQCVNCSRSICVTVLQSDIDNCLTVLASGLANFSAQKLNNSVKLTWETLSESESDFFEVERSIDGMIFESVGSVQGVGSSSEKLKYQLEDKSPIRGVGYYRLKMIDLNGISKYSSIIATNFNELSVQVIPNPTNGSFQVIGLKGSNVLELVDLSGKVLYRIESNESNAYFNALPYSGVYLLRITTTLNTETISILVD